MSSSYLFHTFYNQCQIVWCSGISSRVLFLLLFMFLFVFVFILYWCIVPRLYFRRYLQQFVKSVQELTFACVIFCLRLCLNYIDGFIVYIQYYSILEFCAEWSSYTLRIANLICFHMFLYFMCVFFLFFLVFCFVFIFNLGYI